MAANTLLVLLVFIISVGNSVKNGLRSEVDWNNLKMPDALPEVYRLHLPRRVLHSVPPSERIVGGEIAPIGEYPYHVGIVPNFGTWCGGSLISDQYVLTAAHCVDDCMFVHLYLGAHNIREDEESQLEFKVFFENIIIHPDWNFAIFANDIALVPLPEKIQFRDRIKPIALPSRSDDELDLENDVVTATGWGYIYDNSTSITNLLRYAELRVLPLPVCRHFYLNIVFETNICTSTGLGQGVCTHDDGGPLMYEKKDGTRILVGVTSFINPVGCVSGWATMHARVSKYLDWISEVTGIAIIN